MRGSRIYLTLWIAAAWIFLFLSPLAGAEEWKSGDVIDKTNVEKAQGLVPDPVLNWVKKGDGTLPIGELPYDMSEFIPPAGLKHMEGNKGKYDVGPDGMLVDLKTGKLPEFVDGLPFPEIDPEDPNAGAKVMYNKHFYSYICGNIQVPFQVAWVGRKSAFERELICDYRTYILDGYPPAREEPNPEGVEMHSLIIIEAPFDVKGTNILLWRYRDDRLDSTFAYVPAIRRVRRMSPANRSDAFVGSDFCVDDAWGYAGKINSFDWKLLKVVDQLVPVYPGNPMKLVKNDMGEWKQVNEGQHVQYGFEKEGWQGAPWWPQGIVYVKRPTYIIECKAKDKYYNYGTQHLWVDAGCYTPTYKVISDRAGAYWKTEWQVLAGWKNAEESIKMAGLAAMMAIDDRSQHASCLYLFHPKNATRFYAELDRNEFSLGGFQTLCK